MAWTPPPRPAWVERLIAHGDSAGGAEALVSLDRDDLLRAALGIADHDEWGDDPWREPFEVFLTALERESKLHLAGRLLVRSELVRSLANRLRLVALWKREPALLEATIPEPVFIVGSPRSGTSILHELLAQDPATRSPAMWEMQHPVEARTGEDWSAISDRVVRLAHDLQPEYETMHANSGHLPNECIFITMHAFLSDHWGGQHVVPSYDAYLARADHRPAYRLHRRFLQTLQARGGPRRWMLKAPSHLFQLRALFDIYPDARIIRTHRDPLKTLPSALNLMGTLKWMRCQEVDLEPAARRLPAGFAATFQREIDDRASGALPDDRFVDLLYADLIEDPLGCVRDVYEKLGWKLSGSARDAIASYARRKPKGSHGAHRYTLASVGLERARESDRFEAYCERFGVPTETGGEE
jgi:hypothetical protein